jgi:murein DD-endopeptidase MepM/ murein hydrolase activator NlpD
VSPRRTPHPAGAHPAGPAELIIAGRTRALARARGRAAARLRVAGLTLLGREHVLPVGVALLVALAALASFSAGPASTFGTGNTTGVGSAPRIAVGGNDGGIGAVGQESDIAATNTGAMFGEGPDPSTAPTGPYLADGTLVMPVAVDTNVADGSDKLITYRVRSGDTLTGIAHHFGVSMMSVWWANDLKSKNDLHVGQTLQIPPVSGLVVTVAEGDTIDSLAARTGVGADDIYAYNGLTDRHLVLGQTIIIPGAIGAGISTPKPAPPAKAVAHTGGGSSAYHPPAATYGGGNFAWPVPGGYISQYFHYGHPALDIAAPYGSRIVAAASGTVIFAGYNNNGGGYQVWISHGSGLYTTYNHMSSISVGRGEAVGRGSSVGRVGTSGWATGPHCHFEVWRGYPWEGSSYRVNPLSYL